MRVVIQDDYSKMCKWAADYIAAKINAHKEDRPFVLGLPTGSSPIGVYEPKDGEHTVARFHIDGLSQEETNAVPGLIAPYDTDVYCVTCNKTVHVKAGQEVPLCCGKLMEILD